MRSLSANAGTKKRFLFFQALAVLILAVGILFCSGSDVVHSGEPSDYSSPEFAVRIVLNDWLLQTDVYPQIEAGRTLLPLRFVGEALGARVDWDAETRGVKVWKEGEELTLAVDKLEARVNGQAVVLDVPPRLIQGRTMVPLRFFAENLGVRVDWNGRQRTIFLEYEGIASPPPHGLKIYDPVEPPEKLPQELREQLAPDYYQDIRGDVNLYGIYLGDDVTAVRQLHGSPSWEKQTIYGYSWLAYRDAASYLAVGVQHGKVVSIYAAGEGWQFGDLHEGTSLQTLESRYQLAGTVLVEELNSYFCPGQPTLEYQNTLVTFYPDRVKGNVIAAVRLEDLSIARDRLVGFYRYRSRESIQGRDGVERIREGEEADERLLFDLVNYERSRRGIPQLNWHQTAAQAALGHSREMYLHNYFSHTSAVTGKGPAARLGELGVNFQRMAENIARGQMDAIEAHHGLMNSVHHRPAILDRDYRSLGTGVLGDCYTQKFLAEF